jgi:hypothetical protein
MGSLWPIHDLVEMRFSDPRYPTGGNNSEPADRADLPREIGMSLFRIDKFFPVLGYLLKPVVKWVLGYAVMSNSSRYLRRNLLAEAA